MISTSLRVGVDEEDVAAKVDCEGAKLSNVPFTMANAMGGPVEEYRKRRFGSSSAAAVARLRNPVFAKSCMTT